MCRMVRTDGLPETRYSGSPAFVRGAYRYPVLANAGYLAVGCRCAASVEE